MTRRWRLGAALIVVLMTSSAGLAQGPAPLSNAADALAQLAKDLADQNLPLSQRIEIAQILAGWASPQVRAPLLGALKDPAPELRATAARSLGWAGNREAMAALRERVELPEEDAMVKAGAIEALGNIADPSSRALLVASTKHPDTRVRQAALSAVAFGPLAEPAARVPYLIQLAEDQAFQALLRCEAIRELSNVNEGRVVDAFVRILENEPRFAMALPEAGPGTQQQIMEIRRIQARDVAAWVAEGLGALKATRALALLQRTAEDRSDFFLRLMSLRALITLGVPEARTVFLRRLEDAVPDVRKLALVGLGQLGDRTAVPAVLSRLTDQNPMVRAQAATTLAVLGDATVRPVLEDLQRREIDSNVQYAVEEALTQLPR